MNKRALSVLIATVLAVASAAPVLAQPRSPEAAGANRSPARLHPRPAPPAPITANQPDPALAEAATDATAPAIPLPPASVMSNTQGNPAGATAPVAQPAQASTAPMPKQDRLTLDDVRSKLTATQDFYWESQNRKLMLDFLQKYQVEADKVTAATSTGTDENSQN